MRRIATLAGLVGPLLMLCGSALAGAAPNDPSVSDVVAKLLPSVVNITNISAGRALPGEVQDDLPIPPKGNRSFGSGFIIDPRGYIATNKHVVIGSQRLIVKLHDGTEHIARIVGEANLGDMALIKIYSTRPLPPIVWGTGEEARVGDAVMAIGNPLGIGESVSMGIISATDRKIQSSEFDHFLQTDASINHGNSGGALVNLKGQVIGMNTAIFVPSDSSGSVGLGFAMPADDVSFVLGQLLTRHRIDIGWSGVSAQPVDAWLAQAFGLGQVAGALVTSVDAKGPAAAAGLRSGDVVTGFDGAPVADPQALLRDAAVQPAGTVVRIDYVRERAARNTNLTIAAWPGGDLAYVPKEPEDRSKQELDLGVSIAAITPDVRLALRMKPDQQGVLVTGVEPGGAGEELGARTGNIVLRAGGRAVNTPAELTDAYTAARKAGEDFIPLLIQFGDGSIAWKAVPLFNYR
jgi:serine protease Do